jgi:hypothetical protein
MEQNFLREIKLKIINSSLDINTKSISNRFYFILKKRRIIKDIIKIGGVLTGSRVLYSYRVNNKKIFNRKPKDWDFIMTRGQVLELFKKYQIYNQDLTSSSYYLKRSFAVLQHSYGGESHLFPCNIQIFIKDELPNYLEVDNIRFSLLTDIIEFKQNLIEEYKSKWKLLPNENLEKNKNDLNQIYLNLI